MKKGMSNNLESHNRERELKYFCAKHFSHKGTIYIFIAKTRRSTIPARDLPYPRNFDIDAKIDAGDARGLYFAPICGRPRPAYLLTKEERKERKEVETRG